MLFIKASQQTFQLQDVAIFFSLTKFFYQERVRGLRIDLCDLCEFLIDLTAHARKAFNHSAHLLCVRS